MENVEQKQVTHCVEFRYGDRAGVNDGFVIDTDCVLLGMNLEYSTQEGRMSIPRTRFSVERNGKQIGMYDEHAQMATAVTTGHETSAFSVYNESCKYFREGDVLKFILLDDFNVNLAYQKFTFIFNIF